MFDPARSSLTISGTYAGVPFEGQVGFADSLTASYGGTISAERDFVGNSLQITGGNITAQEGGEYAPFGLAANYGIDTANLNSLFNAIRNFDFSMSSPVITGPSSFDGSQVAAKITSGLFDHFQFDFITTPGGIISGAYTTDQMSGSLTFCQARLS